MRIVLRHEIKDLDYYEEEKNYYEEVLNTLGAKIKNNPRIIGSQFNRVFESLGTSFLLNEKKTDILKYLTLLKGLKRAVFTLALNNKRKVSIPFLGKTLNVIGKETTEYVDFDVWLNCFYLSIILRDRESIDFLISVPDEVMKNANVRGLEFDYHFIKFYKGLFGKNNDIGKLLIKQMELSDPNIIKDDGERLDFILNIKVPELTLFRTIFSSDSELFNRELYNALESHKIYWERVEPQNPRGWISLPLLAASIIGIESRDYTIDIQSDYIPEWLLKGEFE